MSTDHAQLIALAEDLELMVRDGKIPCPFCGCGVHDRHADWCQLGEVVDPDEEPRDD